MPVLRTEQVVGGEHQDPRLGLRFGRERHVDGHLVSVKVRVVGRADQRVQTEGSAFHQDRLESLNAQAVQGRCAVEEHRVFLDDVFQRIPDFRALLVHHLLGGFDVVGNAVVHQLLHDEGAEQLNGHLLRHAALVDLQIRPDNDNAAPGIVDTLAQQVLAEAPLLALEHIREGFEGTAVGPGDGSAPAAVVDEGVHRFLQHPFFIAHDNVRRIELLQAFEAVVAVDHAAVEVVQVGGGKPAAVELDHRAKLRRDHREDVDDHPLRVVSAHVEGFHTLQALDELGFLLPVGIFQLLAQIRRQGLAVDPGQEFLHGFGTHAGFEVVFILLAHVAVFPLGQELALFQRRVARIDDDVVGEVEHFFQHSGRDVQHQPHPAGDALEIPDVGDRRCQFDMADAFAPDLALGHFHAAAVADFSFVADLLILAAMAFPVFRGSEDPFAEKAVPFGLQRPVVDGFGLFHFAVGPAEDRLR